MHEIECDCLKPARASHRDPARSHVTENVGQLPYALSQVTGTTVAEVQQEHTASRIPRPVRLRLRLPPLPCGTDTRLRFATDWKWPLADSAHFARVHISYRAIVHFPIFRRSQTASRYQLVARPFFFLLALTRAVHGLPQVKQLERLRYER